LWVASSSLCRYLRGWTRDCGRSGPWIELWRGKVIDGQGRGRRVKSKRETRFEWAPDRAAWRLIALLKKA